MKNKRLISLDVFRGMTIAGMILVNDPGSWSHIYAPLRHASWHGLTPTDWVFPFFLFIVGVSIPLAFENRLSSAVSKAALLRKSITRSLTLLAIGFGLKIFHLSLQGNLSWESMRWVGVLHRIAIVYLGCAVLYLYTTRKAQAWIAAALLIGYCALLGIVPVPIDDALRTAIASGEIKTAAGMIPIPEIQSISNTSIPANFEPGLNLAAWVDRQLIPGRLWEHSWDPEGILSTLPSFATGILGMFAGMWIRHAQSTQRQAAGLMTGACLALMLGGIWSWFMPFNKNLWSSSFVLYTAGLATLILGAMIWLIDGEKKLKKPSIPFQIFGSNAIAAYVLHSLCGRPFAARFGPENDSWSIKETFMKGLIETGLPPEFVSLLWALAYTTLIFSIVLQLHRKKWFLRV